MTPENVIKTLVEPDPHRSSQGILARRARRIIDERSEPDARLRLSDREWKIALLEARCRLVAEVELVSSHYQGFIHRIYNGGYHAADGIAAGLRAVEAEEQVTVTFVVCRHSTANRNAEPGMITSTAGLSMGGSIIPGVLPARQWRWCGLDGTAEGSMSSAITLTDNIVHAASELTLALARLMKPGWSIYRQPTLEQYVALKMDEFTTFTGDRTTEAELTRDLRT